MVEIRRGGGRRGEGGGGQEGEGEETDIKSNNPHLTGGESKLEIRNEIVLELKPLINNECLLTSISNNKH